LRGVLQGVLYSKKPSFSCSNFSRYDHLEWNKILALILSIYFYTDLDVATLSCLEPSRMAPSVRRAQIFLRPHENAFLPCEISLHKLQFSAPLYSALKEIKIWEDTRNGGMLVHSRPDEVLSCSLIPGSLPPKDIVNQWILESAKLDPFGVIGEPQEAFYKCAMSYVKDASRPLVSVTS
jgi:hypothetical protein